MEFQPAAPSVMPVFWNFNRLRHPSVKDPLLKVAILVNDMLVNPVLDRGLKQVIDLEAKEFKTYSNEGAVWINRRHVDIGNYRYAVLYQLLWRFAIFNNLNSIVESFESLSKMYSSLALKAYFTKHSIENKGDVIECVLADCRFTGPAINAEVRRDRIAFNEAMKGFRVVVDRVLNCTYLLEWPALNRHFIDANLFVNMLCAAGRALQLPEGEEQTSVIRIFEQAVALAQASSARLAQSMP